MAYYGDLRESARRVYQCYRYNAVEIETLRDIMGKCYGGGSGIRTHDTVACITVFKTAAIVHSAIPPETSAYSLF